MLYSQSGHRTRCTIKKKKKKKSCKIAQKKYPKRDCKKVNRDIARYSCANFLFIQIIQSFYSIVRGYACVDINYFFIGYVKPSGYDIQEKKNKSPIKIQQLLVFSLTPSSHHHQLCGICKQHKSW